MWLAQCCKRSVCVYVGLAAPHALPPTRGRCNDAANASFVIDSAPVLCGLATYVPIAFYLTLYSMLFYIAGRWARVSLEAGRDSKR